MATAEEINADMLAFWNGKGGNTWVARQEHTDIALTPVTTALLTFAAPRAGERVVDIGCGAPTLEFARAVGLNGRVAGLDISGPMLAEGKKRARCRYRQCRLATGRSRHSGAGRIQFVNIGLRRDVLRR
ncbi:MAG: class I SAM-dependent methyltransferase [Pseudolabrys sp.]